MKTGIHFDGDRVMHSIVDLSATQLSELIRTKELSVVEVNQAFLDRTRAQNDQIDAWAFLDESLVLDQARALDNTEWSGPLHGIPVGVKDVIEVAGMPTAYGSSIFANNTSTRDAMCISDLREAGAVIFGKTTTTEFATWTPSLTRNPVNHEHTPGGSSSGSAAAVGARMVPYALGTQTVGSTIRPASFCGIVGMKPSFGLLSTKGINLTSQRLDTVGLFANTVDDITALFDALLIGRLGESISEGHFTIRVAKTPWWHLTDDDAREALTRAEQALSGVSSLNVEQYEFAPDFAQIPDLQNTIAHFDIANNLKDLHRAHADQFSKNLGDRVVEGTTTTFSEYVTALESAHSIKNVVLQDWPTNAFVVMPATTGIAPHGIDWTGDPTFCQPWSFFGHPVVTVPTLRRGSDNMPVGVQLIGRVGTEKELLRVAAQLQQELQL